jgi:hypothetical protein
MELLQEATEVDDAISSFKAQGSKTGQDRT